MGDWNDLHDELDKGSNFDLVRRKYTRRLHQHTKRNVIAYYSAWLHKGNVPGIAIEDSDKTGFMTTIHRLDPSKGLDLVMHTPGGDAAATESLVDYLHGIFGHDIRVIVPELAMSAGTMIACASKEILMGKHSSLGPIDPQFYGIPAHGVLEEFKTAIAESKNDPSTLEFWKLIIGKYGPTFLGECQKAVDLSKDLVKAWLVSGMLNNDPKANDIADAIVKELSDHSSSKTHSRHLSATFCKNLGLKIFMLEDDERLQECVLSLHHAYIHTISRTKATKVIENHLGRAFINHIP